MQSRSPVISESTGVAREAVPVNGDFQPEVAFTDFHKARKSKRNAWNEAHDGPAPGTSAAEKLPVRSQPYQLLGSPPRLADPDTSLRSALNLVLGRALFLTAATGAVIVLRDRDGAVCLASVGSAPAIGSRLPSGSSLTGQCFQTGRVVLYEDLESQLSSKSAHRNSLSSLRSILIVPIWHNGDVLGVVEVFSSYASAFNATHVGYLQPLAQGVADIFIAAESHRSGTDILTGPLDSSETIAAEVEHCHSGGTTAVIEQSKDSVPAGFMSVASRDTLRWLVALIVVIILVGTSIPWSMAPLVTLPTPIAKLTQENPGSQVSVSTIPVEAQQITGLGQQTISAHQPPKHTIAAIAEAEMPHPEQADIAVHVPTKLSDRVMGSDNQDVAAPTAVAIEDSAQRNLLGTILNSATAVHPAMLSNAVPIRRPLPAYPTEARSKRVEGAVVLRAKVDNRGKVRDVTSSEGPPDLAQSAINTVKTWRYKPAQLGDTPVESEVTIEVIFRITPDK